MIRRRTALRMENLESRDLMAADPLPVLLVIADRQDFFYQEYADTRQSLLAAGLTIKVGATSTQPSVPHPNSGQPAGQSGVVIPNIALADVRPAEYSAIAFVGGWGASMYQYSFNDPNANGTLDNYYANAAYNGDSNLNDGKIAAPKVAVNRLIEEFLAQDKPVAGICHGTTVLAWARVDGVSPLAGKRVSVPMTDGTPQMFYNGQWWSSGYSKGQYDQAVFNGAMPNTKSGQYGNPTTSSDDVIVDGRIITAENQTSALQFGAVIAGEVWTNQPANRAPVVSEAQFRVAVGSPIGTPVGTVAASDPDGDEMNFAIVEGNSGGAFAIQPTTGQIIVMNPAALSTRTSPRFVLKVRATDNDTPAAGYGSVTVTLTPPIGRRLLSPQDMLALASATPAKGDADRLATS